jgi:hypothetical protein
MAGSATSNRTLHQTFCRRGENPLRLDSGPHLMDACPGVSEAGVAERQMHTCGLLHSGHILCWGLNDRRQASPPRALRFAALSSGQYVYRFPASCATPQCIALRRMRAELSVPSAHRRL